MNNQESVPSDYHVDHMIGEAVAEHLTAFASNLLEGMKPDTVRMLNAGVPVDEVKEQTRAFLCEYIDRYDHSGAAGEAAAAQMDEYIDEWSLASPMAEQDGLEEVSVEKEYDYMIPTILNFLDDGMTVEEIKERVVKHLRVTRKNLGMEGDESQTDDSIGRLSRYIDWLVAAR